MATKTANLKLIKDASTDFYNIEKVNQNMDIIDETVSKINDSTMTQLTINTPEDGRLYNIKPPLATTKIGERNVYKENTTTPVTLKANKLSTVYYSAESDCFFYKASASGTATSEHVLASKTFSNDDDSDIVGTMPNNANVNVTIDADNPYTVAPGFHAGGGVVKTDKRYGVGDEIDAANVQKKYNFSTIYEKVIEDEDLKNPNAWPTSWIENEQFMFGVSTYAWKFYTFSKEGDLISKSDICGMQKPSGTCHGCVINDTFVVSCRDSSSNWQTIFFNENNIKLRELDVGLVTRERINLGAPFVREDDGHIVFDGRKLIKYDLEGTKIFEKDQAGYNGAYLKIKDDFYVLKDSEYLYLLDSDFNLSQRLTSFPSKTRVYFVDTRKRLIIVRMPLKGESAHAADYSAEWFKWENGAKKCWANKIKIKKQLVVTHGSDYVYGYLKPNSFYSDSTIVMRCSNYDKSLMFFSTASGDNLYLGAEPSEYAYEGKVRNNKSFDASRILKVTDHYVLIYKFVRETDHMVGRVVKMNIDSKLQIMED